MIALSDSAVFVVALNAETSEDAVRRFLRGEFVPSKSAVRILRELQERGVDLSELPPIGAPALCRNKSDGPVATGRLDGRGPGRNIFAHRAHDIDD